MFEFDIIEKERNPQKMRASREDACGQFWSGNPAVCSRGPIAVGVMAEHQSQEFAQFNQSPSHNCRYLSGDEVFRDVDHVVVGDEVELQVGFLLNGGKELFEGLAIGDVVEEQIGIVQVGV